ncbi:MAG: N-acetylglucosamine-6-phosphate deacetylase [Clostridia bacterium]|nr:N-acetylglucosamine-6-phosphate deacetylase [Clostridia bacterium]
MVTQYIDARSALPEGLVNVELFVEDGVFVAPGKADKVVDLQGHIVAPGYCDVHTHGAFGVDCVDAGGAVLKMAQGLPRFGVTGFLPAILTAPAPVMKKAYDEAAALMGQKTGAKVLGVHSEGPYFNTKKAGAQPVESIVEPCLDHLKQIIGDNPAALKKIAIAPELPGAMAMIKYLSANGVTVSLGHTEASFELAREAFDTGARSITHLFNALPPLHHRSPGPIAAALLDDRVALEVIADGIHLHPAVAHLAARLAPERCCLITDAMMAAGGDSPDGVYDLGPHKVYVKEGAAKLANGTIAGSVLTMDRAVRNMAAWGVPLHLAICMASVFPRRLHGFGTVELSEGEAADFVVLDNEGIVRGTFVDGEKMFTPCD